MEPSWDLAIPSPLRMESLTQGMVPGGLNNGLSNSQNNSGLIVGGSDNNISLGDPITPASMKLSGAVNDQSPQSTNMTGWKSNSSSQTAGLSFGSDVARDFGTYASMDVKQACRFEIPKVFVAMRNYSAADVPIRVAEEGAA